MMKRVRSFLSTRSLSTPTPTTKIEEAVNPMSSTNLLKGLLTYTKGQEPCASPDKSNTWEAMSDISDRDHDFLSVGDEAASDNLEEVESMSGSTQLSSVAAYDRNHTPLLFAPETVLMIKNGAFVTSSPDGVEQLDVDLEDDSSSTSGFSAIIM
ncbi:MAG: hypothetical protein P1U39_04985 [Legionellaceae bacterium]|nr:hypothetical protein [Legionellaceae bacterium]